MSKRRTRRERGKNKTAQLLALTASLRKQLLGAQRAVSAHRREAREEAMRDLVRSAAIDVDFVKYMLQEASVQMGRMLGGEIGKQLRCYDDAFAQQRKIADAMLTIAQRGLDFDVRSADEFRATSVRISLPPLTQNFYIR